MKVLYVSNTGVGEFNRTLTSLSEQSQINLDVIYCWNEKHSFSFLEKVMMKLKFPLDKGYLNKRLEKIDKEYDYIFIPKGNCIYPKTLSMLKEKFPLTTLISWSLDDMYALHNRSIYYTLGLKYYDLVVTTKSFNMHELPKLGARKLIYVNQPYSERFHKPNFNEDSKYSHDVLFIGHYEKERFESMEYLAEKGVIINIYGPGWENVTPKNSNLIIHKYQLIGDQYSEAITNSKITLCFLRKINRDLHTSRSVEIPACKGCMVAELTTEHKMLFIDKKEAVFFNSNVELYSLVKFYLNNENERMALVNAGYQRCITSNYTYSNMFKNIFAEAKKLKK